VKAKVHLTKMTATTNYAISHLGTWVGRLEVPHIVTLNKECRYCAIEMPYIPL
jgi:hypothetical protein